MRRELYGRGARRSRAAGASTASTDSSIALEDARVAPARGGALRRPRGPPRTIGRSGCAERTSARAASTQLGARVGDRAEHEDVGGLALDRRDAAARATARCRRSSWKPAAASWSWTICRPSVCAVALDTPASRTRSRVAFGAAGHVAVERRQHPPRDRVARAARLAVRAVAGFGQHLDAAQRRADHLGMQRRGRDAVLDRRGDRAARPSRRRRVQGRWRRSRSVLLDELRGVRCRAPRGRPGRSGRELP